MRNNADLWEVITSGQKSLGQYPSISENDKKNVQQGLDFCQKQKRQIKSSCSYPNECIKLTFARIVFYTKVEFKVAFANFVNTNRPIATLNGKR